MRKKMPSGQPNPEYVLTACGCRVPFTPQLPCVCLGEEAIYFCLDACRDDFERDPRTSCLASRFFAQEDNGGNTI